MALECVVRRLLVSYLMLCYPIGGDAECPSGFSKTGNHCIYKSAVKKSFCAALDFSYSINSELVTGNKIASLTVSLDTWIGMTDVLDETTRKDRFDLRIVHLRQTFSRVRARNK